jgi:hypothetical protein
MIFFCPKHDLPLSMESIAFGDGNSAYQVGINLGAINLSAGEFPIALTIGPG